MPKKIMNVRIVRKRMEGEHCFSLVLEPSGAERLPTIKGGQFVNIAVPGNNSVFLRRPISVNRVSADGKELHVLIRIAGKGTETLSKMKIGEELSVVLPLGNGFPKEELQDTKILLIGGGVGVAPLLYYADCLKMSGYEPVFLLGARTRNDILLSEEFEEVGKVYYMTEDGSLGNKGLVTESEVLKSEDFRTWACCGPLPMMKAVAKKARENNKTCFVSLENMMACGIGACLCCVEKTVKGNVCVCKEGPVFNINELTW